MEYRKYLDSQELIDTYNILNYIMENDINRSDKWIKYDLDLLMRIRMYINGYANEFDVKYVDNFIENHNIVFLLRKIIGIGNSKHLENYLNICGNDLSEIVYPNIKDSFDYLDSFDLYLYYLSKYKIVKSNNKERVKKIKKELFV